MCAMTEVLEERLATGDQRLVSENECGESAVKAASGCREAQTIDPRSSKIKLAARN